MEREHGRAFPALARTPARFTGLGFIGVSLSVSVSVSVWGGESVRGLRAGTVYR
jgi:hypothetical protein